MGFKIGDSEIEDLYIRKEFFNVGGLWSWGRNSDGELGDNSIADKSTPVQTITAGTNWKSVAGGSSHTAAIKTDGTLWLWGRNSDGELGDNSIADKSTPVQTITAGTNWKSVAGGSSHTAAIKTDGTLWLWGRNSDGELGDNSIADKSSPVQTVLGGTDWKSVVVGRFYTGAIKTDGTLWTWGSDFYGQLGDNSVVDKSTPVQVAGAGTNWKLMSAGVRHTAAIKTDGTLWVWGGNGFFGQLGDNSTLNKSTPVQTITAGTNWRLVATGRYHTAGIKTDGTLWTWGINSDGGLGDNSIVSKSTPVQTITAGTNWKSVSCGYHTVAINATWGNIT